MRSGLERLRLAVADDVELGRLVKASGFREQVLRSMIRAPRRGGIEWRGTFSPSSGPAGPYDGVVVNPPGRNVRWHSPGNASS
jgi:hypothetical protein